MNAAESEPVEQLSRPAPRRRRSLSFRFGMRSLLIFAILFCLFFAWMGRRYYELRQDEAAIETLIASGGRYALPDSIFYELESPLIGSDEAQANWERLRIVLGLSRRPQLTAINLELDQAEIRRAAAAVEALKRFPEVERVEFTGRAFDDAAMKPVAAMAGLKYLQLHDTNVTGAGLARIAGAANLRDLYLAHHRLPEDFFPGVAKLRSLRTVAIGRASAIDRADIQALASLPELEALRMWDVFPSGEAEALMPLERARSLKYLALGTSLPKGWAGDPPLVPNLETLALGGVSSETLAKWPVPPTLTSAELSLPITQEEAQAFSAAHPECEVSYLGSTTFGPKYRGGKLLP